MHALDLIPLEKKTGVAGCEPGFVVEFVFVVASRCTPSWIWPCIALVLFEKRM